MSIYAAVTALLLVLASVSAIVQARKGRWWTAVGAFLPSLGVVAMLGETEWRRPSFFWLSLVFIAAGLGAEGMAHWKARTPENQLHRRGCQ